VRGSGFIWYELLADDTAAAARFYAAVLGWSARDSGLPGAGYPFFSTGECDVGGLMALPPTDIPGTGRIALVADPQGAPFYLMAPIGDEPSPAYRPGVSGHGGWHELHTRDRRAAREFYAAQFGWRTVQETDVDPMGTCQQFDAGQAEGEGAGPAKSIGGMMDVPGIGRPYWLIYFSVDDLDAAQPSGSAAPRVTSRSTKLDSTRATPGSLVSTLLWMRSMSSALRATTRST
jgi:predicted enzyme related to lactoylglutathione lyase